MKQGLKMLITRRSDYFTKQERKKDDKNTRQKLKRRRIKKSDYFTKEWRRKDTKNRNKN